MSKSKIKLASVLCVAVLVITAFSTVAFSTGLRNVIAKKNGEEKIVKSLNPDVAMDRYIHVVWQENLTGNFEIYYTNNARKNYETTLNQSIAHIEKIIESVRDWKQKWKVMELKLVLQMLRKAKDKAITGEYPHSYIYTMIAVGILETQRLEETIMFALVYSVGDMTKLNILYAEYQNRSGNQNFSLEHVNKSWEFYYRGVSNIEDEKYALAINNFRKALKEAYKNDTWEYDGWDNWDYGKEKSYEELYKLYSKEQKIGIDFGKITRISYTNYDSVTPLIFLDGTINVGWKEIMNNKSHVDYARSTNNGITWWYFDATAYASVYLDYIGVDPLSGSIENILQVTRALERLWIIDGCHYFYAPITIDGFLVEDEKVYAPLNDPYLKLYTYELIYIDGRKFYLICGPGPLPVPPPKAPDLTYQYLHPSKPHLSEREKVVMYANLTNQGDASVSGEILSTFLLKEMLVGNETVSSLHSGEGKQIEKDYQVVAGRFVPIKTIADPKKGLPEGDEKIMWLLLVLMY